MAGASRRGGGRAGAGLTAATADRFQLYQASVQSPELDVERLGRLYRSRFRRTPLSLREDFCGAGLLCAHWVRSHRARTALGVDLDEEVLGWGRQHNLAALPAAQAGRARLVRRDVLEPDLARHEIIVAFNCSYQVFTTRAALLSYFRRVRESLGPQGMFLIDNFGGWEAQQVRLERRRQRGFSYVWEQASYNPIDGHLMAYIHFEFPDGSRLDRAFEYPWRLWTLPELRELLVESGFAAVDVYWEGATAAGRGDGRFVRRLRAENDPRWNAFVAAFV